MTRRLESLPKITIVEEAPQSGYVSAEPYASTKARFASVDATKTTYLQNVNCFVFVESSTSPSVNFRTVFSETT